MNLTNVRRQLHSLPNKAMAEDLDEILGWMEDNPEPPRWLYEYPKAVTRLSYWIGELQTNVRNHESELNRIKGELDIQVRQELVDAEDKITEDKVRRQIYANAAYRSQFSIIAACKGILTFIRGLRSAWNDNLLVQMSVNWRHQAEVQ